MGGWVQVLEKANFSTTGRIESFLSGKKVKRTRYAHQVTLAVLKKLADAAFQDQMEFADFESWRKSINEKNANPCFWFQAIEFEKFLFAFIISLRDADFYSFVKCIEDMMPWMFALDHTHYAKWMSVFREDLKQIPSKYPTVFEEFKRRYFTVKNSNHLFSNIGVDQAHKQNNKLVKIDRGAIGIFENPEPLLRWSVTGPTVAKMRDEYNNLSSAESKHHEDIKAVEDDFRDDVSSVHDAFHEFGNPFCGAEQNRIWFNCLQESFLINLDRRLFWGQSNLAKSNLKSLSEKDLQVMPPYCTTSSTKTALVSSGTKMQS